VKSVLFIHRSVGRNLIADGGIYRLMAETSRGFLLSDYDQNTGVLHSSTGPSRTPGMKFPGGDTQPADYAALFDAEAEGDAKAFQDFVMTYDVVAIKSCYTASNIKSDEELDAIKNYYHAIAEFFVLHPEKQLVILTTPPLRHFRTTPDAALRARQIATWLATERFAPNVEPNIGVFNFFDLLANPQESVNPHTLYAKYCRLWPFDSHPNAAASRTVAPLFVEFLAAQSAD